MSERIVVRDVEQRDFAEWKILWDGYNEFYGRKGETALAGNHYEPDVDAFFRRVRADFCAWWRSAEGNWLGWCITFFIGARRC